MPQEKPAKSPSHRTYRPATADRGATPEIVAEALPRPFAPPNLSLRKGKRAGNGQ